MGVFSHFDHLLGGGLPLTQEVDLIGMKKLLAEGAALIDCREEDEIALGNIPGHIPMPLSRFEDYQGEFPKDRPVVIYCRSGRRSLTAGSIAQEWTKHPIYSLAKGYLGYIGEL